MKCQINDKRQSDDIRFWNYDFPKHIFSSLWLAVKWTWQTSKARLLLINLQKLSSAIKNSLFDFPLGAPNFGLWKMT